MPANSISIGCVLLAAICVSVPQLNAQQPPPAKLRQPMVLPEGRPPEVAGQKVSFSMNIPEEVAMLHRNLEAARGESIDYLKDFANGKAKDRNKAGWAAGFLAETGTNSEQAILVLCANIGKGIPTGDEDWEIPSALTGRGAARALIKIGGSRTVETILERFHHDLSEYELRTYAFVFYEMDKVPITLHRLDLAIEKERKTPDFSCPDKTFIERIEFIKDALKKPDYFSDRKNWPSQRL